MGSWNETDSITNLVIQEDDHIIMVEFPKKFHPYDHKSNFLIGNTTIKEGLYDSYGGIKDENGDPEKRSIEIPIAGEHGFGELVRAYFLKRTWDQVIALPLNDFDKEGVRWELQDTEEDRMMRADSLRNITNRFPDYMETCSEKERIRLTGPTQIQEDFAKIIVFLDKVRKPLIIRTETADENLKEQRWLHNLVNQELTTLENYDPDGDYDPDEEE